MKKTVLLLTFLSLLGCKSIKNTALITDAEKMKFMNSIVASKLRTHLMFVASDEMKGRETGSEGQKNVGKYLISNYKKNNIGSPKNANNYYQKIPAAFLNAKENENLPDSENVCAFIKGSEKPEEVVVLSAHYDHIGVTNNQINNGADDNGTGTVTLLEVAAAFAKAKKAGYTPKRSILFIHMTGEEHGLHGSRFYSENPLFPLKNTVADVNIDMIGRRDEFHKKSNDYIYLIGSDYLSSDLYNICEEQNKKYVNLKIDYKYNDRKDPNRFYYRSDHYNFAKNGIPSVFLFNGTHADYHQPTDDIDKIEFDALEKRARLAFTIVWELANREKRIVVDKNGK